MRKKVKQKKKFKLMGKKNQEKYGDGKEKWGNLGDGKKNGEILVMRKKNGEILVIRKKNGEILMRKIEETGDGDGNGGKLMMGKER